ncbi:MutT/NUDIX family protein [Desmospora sp. 8437]|nr:MutT/NUDIX family protein [Desmospora sp. 8437]
MRFPNPVDALFVMVVSYGVFLPRLSLLQPFPLLIEPAYS